MDFWLKCCYYSTVRIDLRVVYSQSATRWGASERLQYIIAERFGVAGAVVSVTSCGLIIFGLTQGNTANWASYTYALILVGFACFVGFYFIERRAKHPVTDNRLWKSLGFLPFMLSYIIAYGSLVGERVFYILRFFLTIQDKSPLITALHLIPIGVFGSISTAIASNCYIGFLGHFILIGRMVAFTPGLEFFLPQTLMMLYKSLSFASLIFSTFGPDLSFSVT